MLIGEGLPLRLFWSLLGAYHRRVPGAEIERVVVVEMSGDSVQADGFVDKHIQIESTGDDDGRNDCFEGVDWEMKLTSRDAPLKYSTAGSDDGCFSTLDNNYSQQQHILICSTTSFPHIFPLY